MALVDQETMGLRSANRELLERIPEDQAEGIKPELMQSYLEVNSCVCSSIPDAEADLRRKLLVVEKAGDDLGLRLLWSGSHPFSNWRDQVVTANDRYHSLVDLLQDTARQLVTFGLHVHVGVDSGDKAVMICDRILRHLPTLLAMTCNSPFWDGRATGLQSWRSKVMDGLPTAGLPPFMRNWSEYVWLINHLIQTGYIESIREIWWDVRPHHNFGTVEVRICDVPGSFQDTLAVAALIHCLIKALSDEIDQGAYQHDCHPMMIRQNKWRAARYGFDAELVDSRSYELLPTRRVVRDLVEELRPHGEELNCMAHLERVVAMTHEPTWSDRQLKFFEETKDLSEVVRRMTALSRLSE
jgi:carboxylate-amine ligase